MPLFYHQVILCHLTPPNDFVSYRVDSLLVNSVVNYSCWEGFELVEGNLERVCLINQSWSGLEPKCKRKGKHFKLVEHSIEINHLVSFLPAKCCPPPVEVSNAIIGIVSDPYPQYRYSFGTSISYRCLPGFAMMGQSNIKRCLVNKTWLGADVYCKGKNHGPRINLIITNKQSSFSSVQRKISSKS